MGAQALLIAEPGLCRDAFSFCFQPLYLVLIFFTAWPDNDQVNRFAGVVILYPQYKLL
jgi:hypothetical protein